MKRKLITIAAIAITIITGMLCAGCAANGTDTAIEVNVPIVSVVTEPAQTESITKPVSTTRKTVTTTAAKTKTTTTVASAKVTTSKHVVTTTDFVNNIDVSGSKLKYHDYYTKGLSYGKLLRLNVTRGIFECTDNSAWYFYQFADRASTGIGMNGETVHGNGYALITGQITDNRILEMSAVSRLKSITPEKITITFENKDETLKYETHMKDNGSIIASADLWDWDSSYMNGLYEIKADFNTGSAVKSTYIYLFVNCKSDNTEDYAFYLCEGDKHYNSEEFASFIDKHETLISLLDREGVTPETALNGSYHYPSAASASNDDSQYWADLSHEILKGYETARDSTKVLILHDWMTSHLKYDFYKVNVLIESRYIVNGLDPSQYVSKNYTGVCLDFSSIFAIMCRENGIPCVVLNNDTHAWNAVYFADSWYEVDLTEDVNRLVYGEDTNDITNADDLYCYDGFCAPLVNDEIPDTATRFCW